MKRFFYILLIVGLHVFTFRTAYAQEKDESTYIPPSPDAASLLEYANIPVSLYTGTPNINIPLFQLDGHSLEVPVSLSYHASGIKVQDIASSVGLGWTLQAGGVVTRVVRGLPDEDANGFCGTNKIGEKIEETLTRGYLEKVLEGEWDSEPDLFYFSFLGMEGRFILDKDGNPISLPDEDYKIKPAIGPQKIGYWSIIDKNGTTYNFGKTIASQEQTKYKISHQEEDKSKTYVSTWFISEIVSANNDVINFEYSQGGVISYKYYRKIRSNKIIRAEGCESADDEFPEEVTWDENIEIEVLNPKYINRITSSKGEINFSYAAGRSDLSGGMQLNSIVAKSNMKVVKSYNLYYNYFKNTTCIEVDYLCKRLKLEKIQENNGGTSVLKNEFYYNINENLPSRNSVQYDHWGYYNNNTSNTDIPSHQELPGANKSPNYLRAQANTLNEIVYPTGGSTQFEYELHKYNDAGTAKDVGGIRVRQIIENAGVSASNARVTTYNYLLENSTASSGEVYRLPKYDYNYDLKVVIPGDIWIVCIWRFLRRYSQSLIDIFDINGTHIGYKNVQVKTSGNGQELYTFTSYSSNPDVLPEQFLYRTYNGSILENIDVAGPPFSPYSSLNWERGLLKEKVVKSESGKVIKRLSNEHEFYFLSDKIVYGLRAALNEFNTYGEYNVYVGKYKNFHKGVRIKKSVEETYDQGTNFKITNSNSYKYHSTFRSVIARVSSSADLGDSIVTFYKYPQDFPYINRNAALNNMLDRHMISKVIEQKVSIKKGTAEKVVSANLTEYKMDGNLIVPGKIYSFKSNDGISDFSNSNLLSNGLLQYDSRYEMDVTFNDYDIHGNALDMSPRDGLRTSYFWGYNNSYPIAKVVNSYNNYSSVYQPKTVTTRAAIQSSVKSVSITTKYSGNVTLSIQLSAPPTTGFYVTTRLYNTDFTKNSSLCFAYTGTCDSNSPSTITYQNVPAGTYTLQYWSNVSVKADLMYSYQGEQEAFSGTKEFYLENFEEAPASRTAGGAHTGEKYSPSNTFLVSWVRPNSRAYVISYWYKTGGKWKFSGFLPYTSDSYNLSGYDAYDDIRVHPKDAKMTTYTYDPLIGMTSTSDENNKSIEYKYDDLGRLEYIKDHEGNIVDHYEYHYRIQ